MKKGIELVLRLLIALVVLLAAGCAKEEGQHYLDAVKNAIRASDRIVVTEHSSYTDAVSVEGGDPLISNPIVHRSVELNAEQVELFLSVLDKLDPKTQTAFPLCIIDVHHTIHFYSKGKPTSSMGICFTCGQVEWSGTSVAPPASLYDGLEDVVKQLGLEPKRDWVALAQKYLENKTSAGR